MSAARPTSTSTDPGSIGRSRPASRLSTVRRAAAAIAAAIVTELSFELGFLLARGTAFDIGHVALGASLMLGAGLFCIAVVLIFPRVGIPGALALYVALHGLVPPSMPLDQRLGTVGMAVACVLLFAGMRGGSPTARGVVVSTALCVAIVLWSFAQPALALPDFLRRHGIVIAILIFATVILLAVLWERQRIRFQRMPSSGFVCALGLAGSIAGTAYVYREMRGQQVALAMHQPAAEQQQPDVFLLVLDTVRADHLSSYGYARETTPNLVRFLTQHPHAVQYEFAFSPASWTVPAHASLVTGTLPSRHRARTNGKGDRFLRTMSKIHMVADETLPELLSAAGYCTVGVVANVNLLRVEGLERGFDAFFQPRNLRLFQLIARGMRERFLPRAFAGRLKPYPSADAVNDAVLEKLRQCAPRPIFVLANYMEAHSPYLTPEPHRGVFAGDHHPPIELGEATLLDHDELVGLKRDRYDEALRFIDDRLGVLFAKLEAEGVMQRSWIFITSDHGEAFCEHGASAHGSSLYNEQVRIPLIVKPPSGVQLAHTQGEVSLVDVTTTIAALAGRDGFGTGIDLRRAARSERVVAIEFRGGVRNDTQSFGALSDEPARAVVRERWKLIELGGRYELYDLKSDPREQVDRGPEQPRIVDALAEHLPDLAMGGEGSRRESRALQTVPRDELESLRALGYLQ